MTQDVLLKSLPDRVYERLCQQILSGELVSGDRLRQEEIANQLGISRVPVREALSRLEREGLLMFKPRRGYAVTSLDIDEIEEIFDMRMILEERAGYLAGIERTKDDVAAVRQILAGLDSLTRGSPKDTATWAAGNRDFHNRLFLSSGRRQLARLTELLRDKVERYIRLDVSTAGRLDDAQREHHRIFEAYERGDGEAAGRLSREHCVHTCDCLVESLRRRNSTRTLDERGATAPLRHRLRTC
jgi:DNA-binding GntR family transcriptional regulator